MTQTITLHVFRGDSKGGGFREYKVKTAPGMVVLDAIHQIQKEQDGTLACRWNCKAAKCGSCSAEINGHPGLMCKTRVEALPTEKPIVVQPVKTFPIIKDLVTDVSWNYEVAKTIAPLKLKDEGSTEPLRMQQEDVDRVQEFRKCIECFLCQDVCHVLRDKNRKDIFYGPRQMVRIAALAMHPLDASERRPFIKDQAGVLACNITKCCTEVCPEHIKITDNAIIPLKERVADLYFDPIRALIRKVKR
jgi:succinate dehydrogenase / fumarate reductase iron-sulfur subunit